MANIAELVVKIRLDVDQFSAEQQNILWQVDRMAYRFPYLQSKSHAYTKELNWSFFRWIFFTIQCPFAQRVRFLQPKFSNVKF